MAHVLLITKGTRGDLVPFVGLGRALKARGQPVTVLTHSPYGEQVTQAGLNFVALDTPQEFWQCLNDGPLLNTPQGLPAFFRRNVLPGLEGEYRSIHAHCHARDTVLVARHMVDLGAQMVSEILHIPIMRVFTAVAQASTLLILEALYQTTMGDDINQVRQAVGLEAIYDWGGWLNSFDKNLGIWPDWFAAPEEIDAPFTINPVGFVRDDETGDLPASVQEILARGPAPILITGGTGTFLGTQFYALGAETCRRLGRPGLLVTPHRHLVPETLPAQVSWFQALPFETLMPHLAAIIHHGGTSTLAQALAAGIPQLALAAGGDRPDTAARLQGLGVAHYLPPSHWQPEVAAEVLSQLIDSPQVRARCQAWSEQMRAANPAATAARLIEDWVSKSEASTEVGLPSGRQHVQIPTGEEREAKRLPDDLASALAALSPEKRMLLAQRLSRGRKKGPHG